MFLENAKNDRGFSPLMKWFSFFFLIPLSFRSVAQDSLSITKINSTPAWESTGEHITTLSAQDTIKLRDVFKNGKFEGHFRSFYMATNNQGGLTDYYALAAGGGLKYETAVFKGFQWGLSGFYIFNLYSSPLEMPDARTGASNRYEIGLFDLENPKNKSDMDRLEEFYLKYQRKNTRLVLGKQLVNTPFIHEQDGRMRPTEVSGLTLQISPSETLPWQLEMGWIHKISPRGTVRWFSVAESIGLYPQGKNELGEPSNYAGNLHSKGLIYWGASRSFGQHFQGKWHQLLVENILSAQFFQIDFQSGSAFTPPPFSKYSPPSLSSHSTSVPLTASGFQSNPNRKKTSALRRQSTLFSSTYGRSGGKWIASFQLIRLDALKEGGNSDPSKTYLRKGSKALSFGVKTGWETSKWWINGNYNRITRAGRWVMPREWGRDPFFTYLPRERNEGAADVHAFLLKGGISIPKTNMRMETGMAYVKMPSPENSGQNKYGLPAYTQLNVDLSHQFRGMLEGMDAHLLWVIKEHQSSSPLQEKYAINKVNLQHWSMVLNYHF